MAFLIVFRSEGSANAGPQWRVAWYRDGYREAEIEEFAPRKYWTMEDYLETEQAAAAARADPHERLPALDTKITRSSNPLY